MSLRAWNPAVDGPRYKAHSNRFKRLRALAKDITRQGTSKAAPKYRLIAQWFKLGHREDYSRREKFVPPQSELSVFERIAAHWRGDFSAGWPDPKFFRIWVVARNAPDTLRWAYRRLKKHL